MLLPTKARDDDGAITLATRRGEGATVPLRCRLLHVSRMRWSRRDGRSLQRAPMGNAPAPYRLTSRSSGRRGGAVFISPSTPTPI